jgi:hypothetical protein
MELVLKAGDPAEKVMRTKGTVRADKTGDKNGLQSTVASPKLS